MDRLRASYRLFVYPFSVQIALRLNQVLVNCRLDRAKLTTDCEVQFKTVCLLLLLLFEDDLVFIRSTVIFALMMIMDAQ